MGQYMSRRPSIYQHSDFWGSSPTWFAIRVGILMTAVAVLHTIAEFAARWNLAWRSLERFGRSSLFVYWIHVELVYGYATWPIRHRLPIVGTLVAYVMFTALIYAAVIAKGRFLERRRSRGSRPEPAPVTA